MEVAVVVVIGAWRAAAAWWASLPRHAPAAEVDRLREDLARAEAAIASQSEKLEEANQAIQKMQDEISKMEEDKKSYPVPDFLKKAVESGKINLAVSGNSGVGKSSFINFIRDIKRGDPSYAKTGFTECTMKPECYIAKSGYNLWDLPGAGTQRFAAESYVKTMGIRYFDAVFIITAERFMQAELELKKELDNFKVPYFCVRSKADLVVEDAVRNFKGDEDEDQEQELTGETKQELKDKACNEVRDYFKKEYGIDVYLLSNLPKYRDHYDFEKLKQALEIEVSNARVSREASCGHLYCECCRSKVHRCPICSGIENQCSPAH